MQIFYQFLATENLCKGTPWRQEYASKKDVRAKWKLWSKIKLKSVYELEKVTYEKIFKPSMDYNVVIYDNYTMINESSYYFIS